MPLKLDMSKAYDRVEWAFSRDMLYQLGFVEDSIRLIMECVCVCSTKYQINDAGRRFGSIIPSRGIRQGDPLSSYLFLICMEGLSILLREHERSSLLKGIQVATGSSAANTHVFRR